MLPQAVLYLCDSSKYNRLDFSAISATSCSISTGNLPLLQTEWVAQKELLEFKDKFTAFIFTSARAVDGFFESTNNNNSAGIHPIPASSRWFYVVGEATGARLRERLTSISPSSGYIIYGDRQGITLNVKRDGQVDPYHQLDNEKCLNAHQLASLIIRHDNNIRNIMSNSSSSNYPVPVIPSYIFFTGDKTRDVLPDVLIRAGISSQLRQIQVYRTTSRPAEDILADLKQHLQSFSSSTSSSTRLVLLVLFSREL